MTKITFLGTGNAFVPPVALPDGGFTCAWQSNLLLETNEGTKILLDCGTDIRFSLAEQGVPASDIDGVYISHIHADHVGGMEWLAFNTFFNPNKQKPTLFCVSDVLHDLKEVSESSLSPIINHGSVAIEDFFEIKCLTESESSVQISEFLAILPVQVVHVPGDNVRKLSYGLVLSSLESGKSIFWTSDTVFEPTKYAPFYAEADVILQDCELGFKTGVHAHLDDLQTLPEKIKRKMWLYHHNPAMISDANVPDGEFAGFAHKGQTIEF
ncbi:MBL fold metallo-hydrolase [Candidatus Nomurabacteria bacterium]|nr:MBL fold metallo-hydrolase [Candidatus Nomurabacteria bacterium]